MKKKLVYGVLICCCVFGLVGCGKSEAEKIADELGINVEDAEEISAYINGDQYEPAEEEGVVEEIAATDEIINAERFSNKVQIGSTVYTFPLTVEDLLANGELKIGGTYMDRNPNENTLVSPGDIEMFGISGPGVDIVLVATNNNDAVTEFKSCTIDIQGIANRGSVNVIYSGGLRAGMSFGEFTELYGEPDYIEDDNYYYYEDMYYFYDASKPSNSHYASLTGNSYCVHIDMDNACVSNIGYAIGQEKVGTDYIEWTLSEDGYNILCNVPEDILSYGRLVEANDKKYKMSFNAYVEEGNSASLPDSYWNEDIVESVVNGDGTAVVITKGIYPDSYNGYYYTNNCVVVFQINLEYATQDDVDPIPETVKQEAYNIVKEIINKGITVQ